MEEISRSQRRKKRTLDRIIKASYEVLSTRGLSQATLEEIAEAADIGKGTLYGHFESKMHLITYLVRRSTDDLIESVGKGIPAGQEFPERLGSLIQGQLLFFRDNVKVFKLLFFARALVEQKSDDPLIQEIRREFQRYLDFLAESLGAGPGIPAPELAPALAGLASGVFSFWLIEGKSEGWEKRSELLAGIIRNGLRAGANP